jgi:hypothetical protein
MSGLEAEVLPIFFCSAGGRFWPMTSHAAVQHHTRFWGNSRRCAAGLWPALSLFNPRLNLQHLAHRPGEPGGTTASTSIVNIVNPVKTPNCWKQIGGRITRGSPRSWEGPAASTACSRQLLRHLRARWSVSVIGGTRTTTTVAGSPPGTGGPAGTLSPGWSWRSPGTYGDPPLKRVPVCPRFPRPECAMRFTERSTRDHPRCRSRELRGELPKRP